MYLWLLLAGTVYGFLMGLIPGAGVTTALVVVMAIMPPFISDPYAGIVFLTATVAACAIGDNFSSVLLGIPGSSNTAASMFDGYPMTRNGQGARALSICVADGAFSGLLWGGLAFCLLPVYSKVVMFFGIPELAILMLSALACVVLVGGPSPFKAVIGVAIGAYAGLIGQNPGTGVPRLTMGSEYLEAGVQVLPFVAGMFGIPELLGRRLAPQSHPLRFSSYREQTKQGLVDCVRHWRDVLRGGFIGFITGLLPGVGGSIGELLAYGATVARHPAETFGNGNPLGLLGIEGANSAQKASSLVPALLFGIPVAPFAAIMMAICTQLGVELGSPHVLEDKRFLFLLAASFISAGLLVFAICLFANKFIVYVLKIPYPIFAGAIIATIVYSCMQYTGMIADVYMLVACTAVGIICKKLAIPRAATLIAFIVISRLETYVGQMVQLYTLAEVLSRPIVLAGLGSVATLLAWRFAKKRTLSPLPESLGG